MTEVKTLVYGIYPKRDELRIKLGRWERGNIETRELLESLKAETDGAIDQFQSEGITLFTDPLFNWYDFLRPLLESLKGVKLGPLTRIDETNTFYRLPVIQDLGDILFDPTDFGVLEDNPPLPLYLSAGRSNLAFFPGPFTVLNMSRVEPGLDRITLLNRLADTYAKIRKAAGYQKVFLFEYSPGKIDAPDIYRKIAEPENTYLYIRGKFPINAFRRSKVRVESIIVSASENSLDSVSRYCRTPGIQIVDSHTTRIEGRDEILQRIPDTLKSAIVTHQDYMDFLPRVIADQKVHLLGGL
ncbi:MAG TPA: hypothetical protein VKU79_03645 [Thermoplasmataceae archaeon]|nr:hypothetical protein [Thermoplasmatales archaeon AK]HLH85942.1 hypothetical protein [Thermoplasmataceae archaeon]